MNARTIELADGRIAFEPGELIQGRVSWQLDTAPNSAELRLFWFTRGKGTEDVAVVRTVQFGGLSPVESRPFEFRAPAQPHSFSGKLISLVWALELKLTAPGAVSRVEIIIAPGRQEIVLPSLPDDKRMKMRIAFGKS